MRGATLTLQTAVLYCVFQSTLPMRGATGWNGRGQAASTISIHTPHAGSDSLSAPAKAVKIISIHTPHAGSDLGDAGGGRRPIISIHTPHAGSDSQRQAGTVFAGNFNPHSPCGERLIFHLWHGSVFVFQSTLPMRGATITGIKTSLAMKISIHTPHAGSDSLKVKYGR